MGSSLFGEASWTATALRDPARLQALHATGLLEESASPLLDRLTRLAGRMVHAPVVLVSVVAEDRQVFPSAVGLPEPWASSRQTPLTHSFCQHVVVGDAPLIVTDARTDHRVRGNRAITDIGVAAYAGFPLRSPRGQTLGSFCVIDTEPRQWSAEELAVVADLAAAVEAEIEVRLTHAELISESRRRQEILDAAADAVVHDISESEARFRSLFESSPIGMALVGLDGAWLRVNPAVAAITGYTEQELLAVDFQRITHPDDLDADLALVERLVAGDIADYRLHKRYLRRDGGAVWCLLSVTLVRDETGRPQHFLAQIVEVDAERRNQELLDVTFASSPDLHLVTTADGTVVRTNAAWSHVLGWSAEELAGTDATALIHPDDLAATQAAARAAASGEAPEGHAVTVVNRYRARSGEYRWLQWHGAALPDQGLMVANARDITEEITSRRDAEAAAARETERLRATIAVQREVAAVAADRDAALRLVAERTLQAMPAAQGAVVGLVDGAEVRGVAAAGTMTAYSDVRVGIAGSLAGRVVTTGTTLRCDDITTDARVDRESSLAAAVGSMIVAPLFAGGAVFGTLGVASTSAYAFDDADTQQLTLLADALSGALRHADDTAHRAELLQRANAAVAALEISEKQLHQRAQLLDLTQDAVIVRDLDGRITSWNPAAAHIYGWAPEIAAGHDLDRLLGTLWSAGLTRQRITEELHRHGTWAGELEHRRADGRRVTVLSRQALQRDADGTPIAVLAINTDITARRDAEQALRDSEQRFRSQFAHSAIGQLIRGVDDRIQEVNPALATMLGYPPEDLVGTTMTQYFAPEAHAAQIRALAGIFAGQADSYEQECRLVSADGSQREVAVTVSAIRDETGHPERFVGLIQDISDRRAAETARDAAIADLNDRNTDLEAANHLKQDLIGMLGHEMGNPLCAILGYTETIAEEWGDLPAAQQKRMLQAIDRNAHLLDGILLEVLTMVTADAGRLTATPETVPVAEYLDTVRANTDSSGTAIACPAGLTASVQPGHLTQILTNLISNATKYGGGATLMAATAEGPTVRIAVHDAGPGVPPEMRSQLFDRFTRAQDTAGTVKGTGLGLYIVRELARANGGDIRYEPAPTRGSIFVLTLPA
ncbi:PAS domain S-box protein [Actinoplanes sp. NPDC051851]|uniref:PAS domain S-box protein n=1 Tax=Actinoplanes sp. NPDC051851 TaxID=3154753 RepID=UPI003446CF4B